MIITIYIKANFVMKYHQNRLISSILHDFILKAVLDINPTVIIQKLGIPFAKNVTSFYYDVRK